MTAKKTGKKTAARKTGAKKPAKKKAAPKATQQKHETHTHSSVTAPTTPQAIKEAKLVQRPGIGLWNPASIIVTLFSIGRIPLAPGTWGSLVGAQTFPFFMILPLYIAYSTHSMPIVIIMAAAILVFLYSVGVMAIKYYQAHTKTEDAGEIIYDEFFGQILTYSIITVFYTILMMHEHVIYNSDMSLQEHIIRQYTPFIFFRLFDVCKPWPIDVIDQRDKSARGVMLDDILAAFYAAAASIIVFLVLDNYILT